MELGEQVRLGDQMLYADHPCRSERRQLQAPQYRADFFRDRDGNFKMPERKPLKTSAAAAPAAFSDTNADGGDLPF